MDANTGSAAEAGTGTVGSADIARIMAAIPLRYPFLVVVVVVDLDR